MSIPGYWSARLKTSIKCFVLALCTCGFVLGGARVDLQPAITQVVPFAVGQLALVKAAEPTASGSQMRINGRLVPGAWQKRRELIGISDGAIATQLGVDLGSTRVPSQQPVAWFPVANQRLLALPAWRYDHSRYVDIDPLIRQHGWQVTPQGSVLDIRLPASRIAAIRQGRQPWGDRLVLDLSQAAAWQVSANNSSITVTLDAAADTTTIAKFQLKPTPGLKKLNIASSNQRTTLTFTVADYLHPHVWSLAQPHRLVVDIRPDPLKPKEWLWADGLQFQQRYVALGESQFPVYTLTLDPKKSGFSLLPLWAFPNKASGIKPPTALATQWETIALINGGFFNRNNQLPLGALRYNNQWISGPILGRGAIGWDDRGNTFMARLTLPTTVTVNNQTFPVDTFNSGYVQAGIARYSKSWGPEYTSLIDNETVVTVENNQVIQRRTLGNAGQDTIPIPSAGYLLVLRAFNSAASVFAPGTSITLTQQASPSAFNDFPHVLGAGPLLLAKGDIVLNAQQEGFNANFVTGQAPRSVLGVTSDGRIQLVAIQSRINGRGPTLREASQIAQKLGCSQALNLDGGSSSSLYLSGQLINRHPRTAARINNAVGVFPDSAPYPNLSPTPLN
ncbi:MAG: phosphodiester glycosidase family protein [Cyanobacteria bacterium P01_D01_bin.156]